ncbi:MAG: tRNA uridine-5-carboxymethylaminomethyl(34) synthesis GTPase MnmE [Proteobacteria bacterium]|nr:tRNA uridine-5-carboxymethylaminomethyl(34) synthesis GTPase MnmE [Pseudomonadota bacterium]
MDRRDTIFALSSAHGRAGVAVVRVSGTAAGGVLSELAGAKIEARRATLRDLRVGDMVLDRALVLWFPAPASFTGEDVAEFHVHGGPAIVRALLEALGGKTGLRPADPGEFTRRAVENGKFDLTQAEALADLIEAETEGQRKQALRQYEGALGELYESWRTRLIRAAAWAEAAIDFSDEELPDDLLGQARATGLRILREISSHLADSHRGELIREGVYLTLIGPPNSGKSSLLNALAKRDVAIVSEVPGTTRDVLEVRLDLGGYPVIVSDTAGLRPTVDPVEAEGVRRATNRAQTSDITILLLDGTVVNSAEGLEEQQASFVVWNKADRPWPARHEGIKISAKTGEGLPELLTFLAKKVREELEVKSNSPLLTRARHRHELEVAKAALERAIRAEESELMAEDFRLALRAVGRITGRVDLEELLDVIFRDFCIGK